jgi:peptidoglycan/xylan/chitin deacetylase (PgdA/CDA1 family)
MTLLHTARFAGWARGHLLCRVEGAPGRFSLTFDDGPSPDATPRVLDLLARRGARATFFTLAPNVRRSPALVDRMVREGHEVAAHGDLHWPLPLLLPGAIRREIRRSIAAVVVAGGPAPRFYRPPFGFMMPGQAAFVRGLGLEPVLGDIYPEDPQHPGVERIVRRVVDRLRAGSIVILHDGSPMGNPDRRQTVAALDPILDHAAAAGLAAVTVGELLEAGTPRWRWGARGSRSSAGKGDDVMSPHRSITEQEARRIGDTLGIDWATVDLGQFRRGLEVELEHGARDPQTNVTGDDPIATGKIAWAHLKEIRDYYTRLDKLEADAAQGR